MKNLSNWVVSLALLALVGCAAPSTTIKTPMTARPAEREALLPHNGAIFQVGKNEHPLFEDRRPRNVGDTLTINIVEAVNASQSSSNSSSHAGSGSVSTPKITGGPIGQTLLNPIGLSNSSAGSLADKTANAGSNTFTGTISVTVVEVLPNGNLVVGGEKQMSINRDNGYIRLSGVVDPLTITTSATGNIVQSYQVADVHIEYRDSNSNLDKSQVMSVLGSVFRSVLPF